MKQKITNVFFLLILSFICLPAVAQVNVPDEIFKALDSGNAEIVSEYFNQNVQLTVLENDNVYSKAQAQQILIKFFSDYQPQGFTKLYESSKGNAKYVIGNLKTKKGGFRVYFLVKEDKGKSYIHQLTIDKQS